MITVDDGESGDPVIAQASARLNKAAGFSQHETSWALRGVPHAWSNTKQQVMELENHMRKLITEGVSVKFMRDYLISLGYGHADIQKIFEKLTGVTMEDFVNVGFHVAKVPASIPTLNYGWGKAKKGQPYEYYFVMPWNLGYSIFGQHGDVGRDEIHNYPSLAKAREAMEKTIEELHYFDKPVAIKPKEFPIEQMVEPRELMLSASDEYKRLDEYFYTEAEKIGRKVVATIILQAKEAGKIDDGEFEALYAAYLVRKAEPDITSIDDSGEENKNNELAEETFKMTDQIRDKPFDEHMKEVSPKDFFETEKDRVKYEVVPADIIDKAMRYINEKNDHFTDFKVFVDSFKYTSVELSDQLEKSIDIPGEELNDFFSAHAVVSVILKIVDNTLEAPGNEKYGLFIFTVVDSNIVSTDMIKGDDNKMYGLSEEGLSQFYWKERNSQKV
jgi:hypothetical protein